MAELLVIQETLSSTILLILISYPAITHLIGGRGNGLTFTFIVGMLVFHTYNKIDSKYKTWQFSVLALISWIAAFVYARQVKEAYSIVFTLIVGTALFFTVAMSSRLQLSKQSYAYLSLSVLSRFTFSLYLVHYSIMNYLFVAHKNAHPIRMFAIGVSSSIIVAILFYILFERHGKSLAYLLNKRCQK